ncbi:peptidoglycan-binding protein [Brevundimonas vesicularis]|nr:peptidoglycan-binding protein [Brevundimonas vesicularis]
MQARRRRSQRVRTSFHDTSTDRSPDPGAILLDRSPFSPGAIDGLDGENMRQAIAAFETANGLTVDGQLDAEVFSRLAADSRPVLSDYVILGRPKVLNGSRCDFGLRPQTRPSRQQSRRRGRPQRCDEPVHEQFTTDAAVTVRQLPGRDLLPAAGRHAIFRSAGRHRTKRLWT